MSTDILGQKTEERAPRAGWEVAEKGQKEGWARSPSTVLILTDKLTMLIEQRSSLLSSSKAYQPCTSNMWTLLNLNWMSFKKAPSTSAIEFSSLPLLSHVWLFTIPWTAAHQASLSITNSWNLLGSVRGSVQFLHFISQLTNHPYFKIIIIYIDHHRVVVHLRAKGLSIIYRIVAHGFFNLGSLMRE